MKLLTLDSIVRTYLLERVLVWHDYFRVLTMAISGLKKLSEDIDLGTNVKSMLIDVSETGRIILPQDCVKVVNLAVENGDKVLAMSKADNINPIVLRDSQGEPVKRSLPERIYGDDITLTEIGYYYANRINDKGEWLGREFGRPSEQPYLYQQFGGEIQLDVRLNLDCVLLIYQTDGLKVSEANVVNPLAEQAIKFYVDWHWMERGQKKGIWEKKNEGSAYYAEKRNLYGRIHGLTWSEYLRTVRDFQVNAPKY